MDIYQEVMRLIEEYGVEFPEFGSCGIQEVLIARAEKEIGFLLPESYKWWLKNYGGGQIRSDLIVGIDDEGIGKPDIVHMNKCREVDERLVFAVSNDEEYFFDVGRVDSKGEYPVFEFDYGSYEAIFYAESFVEFLRKRIVELCA